MIETDKPEIKKATSLDEQLALIKKRGLDTLYNDEDAKKYLFDIGYYRLGFYFFPFEKSYPNKLNRTHEFKSGYTLCNALNLYDFDYNLRNIVLSYIQKIEISFKTKIIYLCSLHYKDDPCWYIKYKNLSSYFIQRIKNNYDEKFKIHSPIGIHHIKYPKHDFVPAWKLIEYFTFGDALLLFNSLKEEKLKVDISQSLNVRWFTVLDNYLTRIVTIRNICSHNNILFDHRFEKSIKNGPAITINNDNQFKMYSGIRLINYLHNQLPFVETDKLLLDVAELIEEFKNEDEKLVDILDEFVNI